MISRNYKEESIKETPHKVDVRELYNNSSAQILHISLQPGEGLKPHITPVDVVFYVLEGSPSIYIGEEMMSFEKDTLIESPAKITHYISNNSDSIVRIMVIKAPRPQSKTKVV